jgi:hypothetical protein
MGYDYQRPFEHPAVVTYLRFMFFGTTAYSVIINKARAVFDSLADKPGKPEIPNALVAMATVAVMLICFSDMATTDSNSYQQIHAILQDYASGNREDFPTKELEGVWRTTIQILCNIKTVNVNRYHRLMNKLYVESS